MNDDWRTFFGWSFSKSNMWSFCKRRFYYQTIKKFDQDDEGRKAYELSKLTSIDMFAGTAVHMAISEQVVNAAAGGKTNANRAVRYAERTFNNQIQNRMDFIEGANNLPMGPEERNAAIYRIRLCLDNFYKSIWPQVSKEKYLTCDSGKPIKTKIAGVYVWLSIDYLSQDGVTIKIRDWKTGDERDAYKTQLATYAIYTMEKYDIPIEKITAEVVYLSKYRNVIVPLSARMLKEIEDKIVQESQEILSCRNDRDFFTNPGKGCMYCNFATICEGGKASLNQEKQI